MVEYKSRQSVDKKITIPENIRKLSAKTHQSHWEDGLDFENLAMIVHQNKIALNLINIIPIEDVNAEPSTELSDHIRNISQDFLNMVVEPMSKGALKFLKKHPEYEPQQLDTESSAVNGLTFAQDQVLGSLLYDLKD